MGTKIVGKLDNWGDADLGGNDFMKLEEGNNPIRMITSPYQFYIHWSQDSSGANRKARCALEGCPLCKQGERAAARWYVGVINRKTGKPAVLEIGPQIFKQVLGLAKKEKWGDPRKFDLDIEQGAKGSQPLYIVSPEPKEPLTDEEKATAKEFLARVDLAKMSAAATVEEVLEKMGMAAPVAAAKKEESVVSNDFDDATSEPAETTEDSSDDFDFDN